MQALDSPNPRTANLASRGPLSQPRSAVRCRGSRQRGGNLFSVRRVSEALLVQGSVPRPSLVRRLLRLS